MPAAARTLSQRLYSLAMNAPNSAALEPLTTRLHALAHLGIGDHVHQRGIELGDHRHRQAGRTEQAVPRGHVVARQHARFGGGRHVGHGGEAILAGDRQRLEIAGLNLADDGRYRLDQKVGMFAEQSVDRLG